MCGFLFAVGNLDVSDDTLLAALSTLESRGPDAEGIYKDDSIFAGHKRLAIQDLDSRSDQPFWSDCGRFLIVYNGEIYNFRALKTRLREAGVGFRTESDTEVLLKAYQKYGNEFFKHLEGMFAFVIWDFERREGVCARDPYGIKPLYFTKEAGGLIFASQVRALKPALSKIEVDQKSFEAFKLLGSVPEPGTYIEGINSIRAGQVARFDESGILFEKELIDISSFWHAPQWQPKSKESLSNHVCEAVKSSVRKHLVSDVPVGIFLSGGIDSGVLAALCREMLPDQEIIGVTVSFDEFQGTSAYEEPIAAVVAEKFGITHFIKRVSRSDFIGDLPAILEDMDQPSIDGINTWYAAKAASEIGLKVVLTGAGGDELFFGYSSYFRLGKYIRLFSALSAIPFGRTLFSASVKLVSYLLPSKPKIQDMPRLLSSIEGAWLLDRASSTLAEAGWAGLEPGSRDKLCDFLDTLRGRQGTPIPLELARLDSTMYLRNQLLRDADWATMAHSIELRAPFVDTALLKGLSGVFAQMQIHRGKSLLADVPIDSLPNEVVNRAKTGFGIPVNRWLEEADFANPDVGSRSPLSFAIERHFFG